MKKTALLLFAASLLLFSCNNSGDTKNSSDSTVKKEPAKEEVKTPPMDSATMMKNWQAYMTPGEMHKMMASWNGTWNTDVTMWMKPDVPPQKSNGTAVNKMILGGRYQESVNTSTMMGMPFEGHGTLAYDNIKKVFQSTWVDNMGSGIMMMSGPWDSATKTVTLTGKSLDPMSGRDYDFRETFNVVDDNTQMMIMYGPGPDGKEYKMMEKKFTRKK